MYRPEHPNPQFERENWMNLNGPWEFAFDHGKSGLDRKLYEDNDEARQAFVHTIEVPFCPESSLSGIGCKDFMDAVWYRRTVSLTGDQVKGRTILHFGAVDYEAHVFVNGAEAGKHMGGYVSFALDVTAQVHEGENTIVVCAVDDVRGGLQPAGKQSGSFYSHGCMYTRTTGIWQTVWLEFVPEDYVKEVKYYPDIAAQCFHISCKVAGAGSITFTALYEGKTVGSVTASVRGDSNQLTLPVSELHLWECGQGRLYDIVIEYGGDRVTSYAGMRQVRLDGYQFKLNGKTVFQRTVLDQGFYRDGIYTAPTDEILRRDIELSMDLGFNGARLHEKIFEPRFLYHCDKAGYLVWGEFPNWGLDLSDPMALMRVLPEWMEEIGRDFNHPAVIGWCPFNETWDYNGRPQIDGILANVYQVTKALDPTRPCIDTSGNFHVVTDVYDLHNYDQLPESFAKCYQGFPEDADSMENHRPRQRYTPGLPLFISEYGGIKWDTSGEHDDAWGYGSGPKTVEEFIERYRGLTSCLLEHPYIMGFCYTQLYDVEQEVNGLYDYDRKLKFDAEVIRAITAAPAAIEKED